MLFLPERSQVLLHFCDTTSFRTGHPPKSLQRKETLHQLVQVVALHLQKYLQLSNPSYIYQQLESQLPFYYLFCYYILQIVHPYNDTTPFSDLPLNRRRCGYSCFNLSKFKEYGCNSIGLTRTISLRCKFGALRNIPLTLQLTNFVFSLIASVNE